MFISLNIFTLVAPRLWHIIQTLSAGYMQTYGIFGQLIVSNSPLARYVGHVYFDAKCVMGI